MLNAIREKLKTWVVVILVVLVAIPLIFLGVGDYGTNQEQYAFKVNDQEISRSVVLQEMGQFKDVLRKNYQGSIPPIYTEQFIKRLTFDNLIRRNIENNISSDIGLVLSDESIVSDIKNTSSFKDENGFNPKLYKKRLFMINMNPDVYEQYIYQKGIRDQLRKSITDTSILSLIDKKININSNYHKKIGNIYILKNQVTNKSKISLDDINNYFETNKSSFLSNQEAIFSYVRLDKNSIIKSIKISEAELERKYNENLKTGQYTGDILYEINHLVFPIQNNEDTVLLDAKNALKKLKSNQSFRDISINHKVSDDTKANFGYLGKQSIQELPDIIKTNISKMNNGEIKLITSQKNAIHIIKLISSERSDNKEYSDVRGDIEQELRSLRGSEKYFTILDSFKEKLYVNNTSLIDLAKYYNLELIKSSRIDQSFKNNILSSNVISSLFSEISSNDLYPPIYIGNDDVLFVKKEEYFPPRQLSLNESEEAIRALLTTQRDNDNLNRMANMKLKSLNEGIDNDYEYFSLHKYDKKFNDEIMELINNQPVSKVFVSHKLTTGDYIFLKMNALDSGEIDKEKIDEDNFLDYLRNTQSESDYNRFYTSKYDTFEIDINQDYFNQ